MSSLLVVGGTPEHQNDLSDTLSELSISHIAHVSGAGEALRNTQLYDYYIINTPLSDEFGHSLAVHLAETTTVGILVLIKADLTAAFSEKLERLGILVLPKPISKPLFVRTVRLMIATRIRLLSIQKENEALRLTLDEVRLIDRAKCLLIQYLGMSEAMAHRYIEKQAMDMRRTRAQIAEDILKTYEA